MNQIRKLTTVRHLLNDGVEESPPSTLSGGHSGAALSPNPHQLFISLEHANVGFRHWHPMPVTQNGNKLSGQGELGGVWEWTSSVLEKYDGFEPTALYPGYTGELPLATAYFQSLNTK